MIKFVVAEGTFCHFPRFFVIFWRAIGTCPGAVAATDTCFRVDQNDAVFAFVYCPRWANFRADGTLAMVARHGKIIGKDIGYPGIIRLLPITTGNFINSTP